MSEIVLSDFDPIKGPGSNSKRYLALCLWHDDSKPSLMIYHDNYFKCLGCGEQGGFVKLYAKMNEVKGTTGLKTTAARGGTLPSLPTNHGDQALLLSEAHHHLQTHSSLRAYLDERRLSDQIDRCEYGYWDGWITIPVVDENSNIAGMVARATPNKARQVGLRFLTPPGQPPLLYAPSRYLLRQEPVIFVVFGMFDAPTLVKLGFAAVTTTAGKDSFDPSWLDEYRKPIVIVEDRNETDAALRPVMTNGLDWRYRHLALDYPEGIKDPNDFLMQYREAELVARLYEVRLTYLRRKK